MVVLILNLNMELKRRSFTARLTSVLILNAYSSMTPIITNLRGSVKFGGTDFEFEFGTDTQVYRSCSINWKGDLYVFGGATEKRQVSLVDGCQLTRVSTLSFDLYSGACTNVNNKELFLCFDYSDGKKCWKSSNPEGPFSFTPESLKNHKQTRIANDQGKLTF